MATRLNRAIRWWLRLYDAQPFIWAMLVSNSLIFLLFYGWVLQNPFLAIPVLAFVALWFSLVTGSLLELLRQGLIRWLHRQGPPSGGVSLDH